MLRSTTLREYFRDTYRLHHWLSDRAADDYDTSLRKLDEFHGSPVQLRDLTDTLILSFMASLKSSGLSPRTVNNKRQAVLSVWQFAADEKQAAPVPRIRKIPEPRRKPLCWGIDELRKILESCKFGPCHAGWDGRHWRALILTAFDTSHRISPLLLCQRDQLYGDTLCVRAEQVKQLEDVIHVLHEQTLRAIAELPATPLLFQWPMHKRQIWLDYGVILKRAGLPATSRDKFHKLRRTSYTHVYAELGKDAASQHAGHRTDMSRFYLDERFLRRPVASAILPRP